MKQMMVAALRHTGGFALLDILQPCVSFNPLNTYEWYRERVRVIDQEHDPTDREEAMRLALRWGDEVPIGLIYRCERPSFESQVPVLERGTLLAQLRRSAGHAG